MGLGAQGPGRGRWVGVLERPGTGEQSRDSAVQSQEVDSRKGQVGTCSEQACLLRWNSPSQRRQGARDFLLPSEFTREPLSGLNQVAGSEGNGLRILTSEGSVPGLRICSLCEHGTKPLLFPNKRETRPLA